MSQLIEAIAAKIEAWTVTEMQIDTNPRRTEALLQTLQALKKAVECLERLDDWPVKTEKVLSMSFVAKESLTEISRLLGVV